MKQHGDALHYNKKIEKQVDYIVRDILICLILLILATLLCLMFQHAGFRNDNLIMIYILGVLFTALKANYRLTGMIYGIISIILFYYYFTEPVWKFRVDDPAYLVTFLVMLVTTTIISTLTRQVKAAAAQAIEKSQRTEILLNTSQKLLQAGDNLEQIVGQTMGQIGNLVNARLYCFLENPEQMHNLYTYFPEDNDPKAFSAEGEKVIRQIYENGLLKQSDVAASSEYFYQIIKNDHKIFAVIAMELDEKNLSRFERGVITAILSESTLAFEKEEVSRKEREMSLKLEQERFRANLLRMISHDLRTPLTSISGNADMLIESASVMSNEEKEQVYTDIYEDALWLINLVENLLSITRIENGTMRINMQAELISDVVEESMCHLKHHSLKHKVAVKQDNDMLVARMDARLIIQVIINLVDNALKYTPQGTLITLLIYQQEQQVIFEVSDTGNGISDKQKKHIFDMFYTGDYINSDGKRGMGMGLPLCQSIIKAHGGTLWIKDNQPHGAIFGFALTAEEVNIT